MEFTVQAAHTKAVIPKIASAIETSNKQFPYDQIILEVQSEKIVIEAGSQSFMTWASIPANVVSTGKVHIPGKLATSIFGKEANGEFHVKEVEGSITIESIVEGKVVRTFTNIPFVVSGLDTRSLPKTQTIVMPSGKLLAALDVTMPCATSDTSTNRMAGVYIETIGNKLVIMTTDQRNAACSSLTFEGEDTKDFKVLVPKSTVEYLIKAVGNTPKEVTMLIGTGRVGFTFPDTLGDICINSATLSYVESFAGWRRIIPEELTDGAICLTSTELTGLVSRAEVVSTTGKVTMEFNNNEKLDEMIVIARDDNSATFTESISCTDFKSPVRFRLSSERIKASMSGLPKESKISMRLDTKGTKLIVSFGSLGSNDLSDILEEAFQIWGVYYIKEN